MIPKAPKRMKMSTDITMRKMTHITSLSVHSFVFTLITAGAVVVWKAAMIMVGHWTSTSRGGDR
ncbi:hypothetical protein PENTCL1PPCAC_4434 [Pristionchus entomophagus]|uniref:Uncharacterized protein n=1 Tax=Pristionchus entomophagus TaxID=358040 RepID=A0AAV5SLN0_9BILA|nr:hypothetical protein PENTCL1PPCAC_4434 [Pristionchus entomophagus]